MFKVSYTGIQGILATILVTMFIEQSNSGLQNVQLKINFLISHLKHKSMQLKYLCRYLYGVTLVSSMQFKYFCRYHYGVTMQFKYFCSTSMV